MRLRQHLDFALNADGREGEERLRVMARRSAQQTADAGERFCGQVADHFALARQVWSAPEAARGGSERLRNLAPCRM